MQGIEVAGFEQSPINIKNKIFLIHSKVEEERMKRFISGLAFIYAEDPSVVNQKQYGASRFDSTLIRNLMAKIYK